MLRAEALRKKLCHPFCLRIIFKYYSGPFLGTVSVPKFRRSQEIQREMEDIKGPQSNSIKLSKLLDTLDMHIYMTLDQEIQSLLKTLSEADHINPEVIITAENTQK